jgi:protocatechuate 3,4-dioxygenase beta subunit
MRRAGSGSLSILPESYPIPDDGTVGQLLHTARRNIMRPAHVHVRIEAPGYRRLTTMLFLAGDPYLDADPVFGVKQSLVMPFEGENRRARARRQGGAVARVVRRVRFRPGEGQGVTMTTLSPMGEGP